MTLLEKPLECPDCSGTGQLVPDCPDCIGYGWVDDPKGGTMTCPQCKDLKCECCEGLPTEEVE